MLSISDGYRQAIVGDVRQMALKAVLDIIDPDVVYAASSGSGLQPWAKPEQLYNKVLDPGTRYATLECNRWLLGARMHIFPEDLSQTDGQIGHVGTVLSGTDGTFAAEVYAELGFSNVSILQACSVYFGDPDVEDGVGVDLRVVIYSGAAEVYSREITDNRSRSVSLDGFTVHDPTRIRVYVTRWSIPGRYLRVMQIIPGVYEEWTADMLATLDIQQRGNFSGLALPYGTATLRMDNLDRRFEPRNRSGVFESIEERQGIPIALGVVLEDGSTEWQQVGVYYQANGGWRTSDNSMTMEWELVDIVGLVANREFAWESNLPTTLAGWVSAVAGQLGPNFADRWHVDSAYADLPVTCADAADVIGQRCGDLLRWAAMITGTWIRADAQTGDLTAEPFWSEGNKLDLDNMVKYPTMRANDDLSLLTFRLHDADGSVYSISGNTTSSSETLTINNPFIRTKEQALAAARQILSQYGGLQLETLGRGDPAGEIGDVDTLWLDASTATTARRMEQSFSFKNGVLQNCKSVLLQADGSFLFQQRAVLTESGSWTAPEGVTQLRLILVGHGADGTDGTDGTWDEAGVDGADGAGGKVWADTVEINPGQTFAVTLGQDAVFGSYSSANGKRYPNGYTDVASGDSYARTGVPAPLEHSGDGGAGGAGGVQGHRRQENYRDYTVGGRIDPDDNKYGVYIPATRVIVDNDPGNGQPGAAGSSGCAVIYWAKEDT